ncbi:MAG: hypothetical protein ACK4JY_01150 [Brevundimonas sp.]|uniref:hypothetical protein n=1 Tax=Brevundimonas sp. TaxID=1871086 RepID=UPI0039199189
MFKNNIFTVLGASLALALAAAQPASAGSAPQPGYAAADSSPQSASDRARTRQRNDRERQAPAAPTAEENRAAAQTLATSAGVDCQVSEATLLGVTAESHSTYELVCAGGSGWLIVGSTPPQTFNCIELAGQAETSRLRDPEADVGQQCTLPVNLNPVPVLSAYAAEAGVDCTVDQAAAVGKNPAGDLIYEIGCADRDGYWIEKAGDGWKTSPCWDLALQKVECRYTTAAETAGAWTTILAGTDAAACVVQEARRVGRDVQGLLVYEVKCGAGDGYFARIGETRTAQRVHACTTPQAAALSGGCTLTAAAPATTEQ